MLMIDDNWQDTALSLFQKIIPISMAVIVVLCGYLPIYMGIFNNIRPDMGLVAIYFWMLHRSDLFDLKSVVLLGLIDGSLTSSAFGLGLFAYLVMYLLMINLRKFLAGKSFVVIWYGYMALSLITIFLKWLVADIYYAQFLPIGPLIFSYLIGAAAYPVISMVFALIQNSFLQDDEL